MTAASAPGFRTVSFGDLDGRCWGTALDAGLPAIVFAASGATGSAGGPRAMRWSEEDDGDWKLFGDDFELLVTAAAAPAQTPGSDSLDRLPERALEPADELCRVIGRLVVDGAEHAVDCTGTRSFGAGLDPRRAGSLRRVCGWFAGEHAVSLLAFRPRDSAGQEGERLAATVFDVQGVTRVAEPRLSTTYGASGQPTRAYLELWIGGGEEAFPCRAAAEAHGAGAGLEVDGLVLLATPLRCHSRGLDGPGVYTLARF